MFHVLFARGKGILETVALEEDRRKINLLAIKSPDKIVYTARGHFALPWGKTCFPALHIGKKSIFALHV
ncbi:hypothetical protein [uncultured Dysosmobacter sp.]|uniref:hypothetical protein n=1 Tax=uncultured Dysosmobacter sp. TaxID=2591384 RepID=UPI002608BC5B|nr:hypothetical protein [uncultured Dysosmobacter sp.]